MNGLIEVEIFVTTVVIWLFALGYAFFAPWWRSPMGRNVMAMSITHGMIFGLISTNMLLGTSWGARPIVRVVIYGSILFVFAWRGVILIREQVMARREDQGGPSVQ